MLTARRWSLRLLPLGTIIRPASPRTRHDAPARLAHHRHLQARLHPLAACASLLKLNPEQTSWALGLAGTQGAGTWAFNADGTMSKRLHAGKAAHSGVLAAELAALGFTGPTQIYEYGDGGVLKAHSDDSDVALLTRDLGRVWHTKPIRSSPTPAAAAHMPISMQPSRCATRSAGRGT